MLPIHFFLFFFEAQPHSKTNCIPEFAIESKQQSSSQARRLRKPHYLSTLSESLSCRTSSPAETSFGFPPTFRCLLLGLLGLGTRFVIYEVRIALKSFWALTPTAPRWLAATLNWCHGYSWPTSIFSHIFEVQWRWNGDEVGASLGLSLSPFWLDFGRGLSLLVLVKHGFGVDLLLTVKEWSVNPWTVKSLGEKKW